MTFAAKTATVAVAFAAATLSASIADASSLNISSVGGVWTSMVGQGGTIAPYMTGVGTSTIAWGEPVSGSKKSSYSFAGNAPTGPWSPDQIFVLGTFTHNNVPVYTSSLAGEPLSLTAATLTVDIGIDIAGTPESVTAVFDFGHEETSNLSDPDCPFGVGTGINENGCADKVTADTDFSASSTFTIGNTTYIFEILGFCPDCTTPTPAESFLTKEDSVNEAKLLARYTSYTNVVPLPAAGWLLLAGIGGLGMVARRRNKA